MRTVLGFSTGASSGTTNGALTACLVRHHLVDVVEDGPTVVLAEQGYECGRPSQVRSEVTVVDDSVERLVVGSYARKSITGDIFLSGDDG